MCKWENFFLAEGSNVDPKIQPQSRWDSIRRNLVKIKQISNFVIIWIIDLTVKLEKI